MASHTIYTQLMMKWNNFQLAVWKNLRLKIHKDILCVKKTQCQLKIWNPPGKSLSFFSPKTVFRNFLMGNFHAIKRYCRHEQRHTEKFLRRKNYILEFFYVELVKLFHKMFSRPFGILSLFIPSTTRYGLETIWELLYCKIFIEKFHNYFFIYIHFCASLFVYSTALLD